MDRFFKCLKYVSICSLATWISTGFAINKIEIHNKTADTYRCHYGNETFYLSPASSHFTYYAEQTLSCKKQPVGTRAQGDTHPDRPGYQNIDDPATDDLSLSIGGLAQPRSYHDHHDYHHYDDNHYYHAFTRVLSPKEYNTAQVVIQTDDAGKVYIDIDR